MAGVEVTIRTQDKELNALLKALANISPAKNPRIMRDGITRIILAIQAEFGKGKIIKAGREHAPPLKTNLTSRHGGAGLLGSIGPDFSKLPREGSLGTALRYAEPHETGGTFRRRAHTRSRNGSQHSVKGHSVTMPKRAFMRPAITSARPQMASILVKLLEEEASR